MLVPLVITLICVVMTLVGFIISNNIDNIELVLAQKPFSKFWVFNFVVGVGLGSFFYVVQSNAYGDSNSLSWLNDLLNGQTSATSFCIVLVLGSTLGFLLFGLEIKYNKNLVPLRILICLALFVAYLLYEVHQLITRSGYLDNHLLDVKFAFIATMILLGNCFYELVKGK